MTLNKLVHRAASVYQDAHILAYWDEMHECAINNPGGGDGLAAFIAWELYETFDPDADDATQITTAMGALQRAADCLSEVARSLDGLSAERLAA
jgi:hypothetical protein